MIGGALEYVIQYQFAPFGVFGYGPAVREIFHRLGKPGVVIVEYLYNRIAD